MTNALTMFYYAFIDSAIKCVIITSACIYILYKCHLLLGSNWPINVSTGGVLVIRLVSVCATHYSEPDHKQYLFILQLLGNEGFC